MGVCLLLRPSQVDAGNVLISLSLSVC